MEPNKNMPPVTSGPAPTPTPNMSNPNPIKPVASPPTQPSFGGSMGASQIVPPYSPKPMMTSQPNSGSMSNTMGSSMNDDMAKNMSDESKTMTAEIYGQDTQPTTMTNMPMNKKSYKNIIIIAVIIVLIVTIGIIAWMFL